MEIVLHEAQIGVAGMPGGQGKLLQFVTPQGIRVTVPLTEEAAKQVASMLTSGILVASSPLPPIMPPANGGRKAN